MTSSNYTESQRAEGKIGTAIRRTVDQYLFHCRVLEQFKIQERPAVGTMAVTVAGGDILLLYNAGFVLSTPMAELVGMLLHEVAPRRVWPRLRRSGKLPRPLGAHHRGGGHGQ